MSYDFKLNNSENQFDRLDLDLELDHKGGFKIVENRDKLGQDVNKVLLTNKGSNVFHQDYGSEIRSYIGVADREEIIEPRLKNTTEFAVNYYKDLQTEQMRNQFVSLSEKLDSVKYIDVKWAGRNPDLYLNAPNLPPTNAKTTYNIKLGLITGENTNIVLNLVDY